MTELELKNVELVRAMADQGEQISAEHIALVGFQKWVRRRFLDTGYDQYSEVLERLERIRGKLTI